MDRQEFHAEYGKMLNDQQQEAVYASEDRILLLAVPGSGKTTVLVTRLGYLVTCCRVPPEQILTMTFTTAAAGEMRDRFGSRFGRDYARNMLFCTINGLCSRMIRQVADRTGREPFSLIGEDEAQGLIRELYVQINHEIPTESVVKDVRSSIGYIKNMNLSDEEIQAHSFSCDRLPQIYQAYHQTLRAERKMDFDDQLVYACRLLHQFPQVLESFRQQYRYLFVDEAQDTSLVQHEIIRLLVGKRGKLFMVGDEDQSIYGFRGAYPQALLNFETDYPGARILTMEHNYRSVPAIVETANRFIRKNQHRRDKTIRPVRTGGARVQILPASNRDDQFDQLLDILRTAQPGTAVLYRNNDSALPLVDLLDRNGIAFGCLTRDSGETFFSHRIVTDLLEIIHFADDRRNTELFLDFYYKIGLRLTRELAEYICSLTRTTGRTIPDLLGSDPEIPPFVRERAMDLEDVLDRIPDRHPYVILGEIWNILGYQAYVRERKLDAGKFQILRILARQEKTCQGFLRRLEELQMILACCPAEGKLILSTIHSSKGLEYDRVYLLDVLDGILPQQNQKTDEGQYEEDRRIFYVGMTRAREELTLFSCRGCPSEFTDEVSGTVPAPVPPKPQPEPEKPPEPLHIQARPGLSVMHRSFGSGVIQSVSGDLVKIQFTDREVLLSWKTVLGQRLLEV